MLRLRVTRGSNRIVPSLGLTANGTIIGEDQTILTPLIGGFYQKSDRNRKCLDIKTSV